MKKKLITLYLVVILILACSTEPVSDGYLLRWIFFEIFMILNLANAVRLANKCLGKHENSR